MDRRYIAIDLKSFYASVECMDRKLDPMTTNLVVADPERTEKTICLAVSPSLKACGISGRARLFEVIERVREVNAERLRKARAAGFSGFSGSSSDARELAANPDLELSYVVAPPRMLLYEKISTDIYAVYLRHISSEDIHVYSIDECFIDATGYLKAGNLSARELASTLIREVLKATGITATAGVGTNLYLAKAAMDIMAKHVQPDQDGVRIAELDERTYREQLWCHRPLTDFWRVGRGIAKRLEQLGCRSMGDVARLSRTREEALYHALGVNAELLIDHAWGWEPTEIPAIRGYKPESSSLSNGQVLAEPYPAEQAKLIVREMTEAIALELVRKKVVTKQMVLTLHYDRSSILPGNPLNIPGKTAWIAARTGKPYQGETETDRYGRPCPRHAHGTANLDRWTSSSQRITAAMAELFDRIIDPDLTVRRIGIAACNLTDESEIPAEGPVQLDFFSDPLEEDQKRQAESAADEKERKLQMAALAVHGKFGKNALLKAMNLQKGATAKQRNAQIGGHRAGDLQDTELREPHPQPKAEDSPGPAVRTKTAERAGEDGKGRVLYREMPGTGAENPRVLYADIIDLPHWDSPSHPRMSMQERAAQFAPYAALVGYGDLVKEEARETEARKELSGDEEEELSRNLAAIDRMLTQNLRPVCRISYFVPDPKKAGGETVTVTEAVRRIDPVRRRIILAKKKDISGAYEEIEMDQLIRIIPKTPDP